MNSTQSVLKTDIIQGLGITHDDNSAIDRAENEVLPTTDQQSSLANKMDLFTSLDMKDKTKPVSRMKELLRWAAKADRGGKYIGKVLHFRSKSASKTVADDYKLSNESPKISFRWDEESCSTMSSAYFAISVNSTPFHVRDQCVARTGNWITTDSECKILTLKLVLWCWSCEDWSQHNCQYVGVLANEMYENAVLVEITNCTRTLS
ncbi:hypothetical protein F511_08330 [Dorcoceras hygrometricum]|uniref:Uncharacterized protein n=1 Tax=Dorcoceras hygrometricum TaxID=472368 RepID=A0A2Z7DA21_9LAMI|nr:hypothetical protein F511_08330 [Dorcoceras hygrometricum]